MLMNYDGSIRIGTELETKEFEAQYKDLENKLDIMVKTLKSDTQVPVEFRMSNAERLELEATIEKTRNELITLKDKMDDVGSESDELGKKVNRNFKEGTISLKRFALSLFSIGSIYAMVSKASDAYLSQNTELANKLQSVWAGLGSFLAPLIEGLSDVLLKGLGYLNEFIKALTGIDFIANANAKAIQKQVNAQKELNRQTYSFDEMNKEQDTSASSFSSNSGSSGLINIPELDSKIVSKLQDMAYWLRENWDLVEVLGVSLITVFAGVKLVKMLSGIGKLLGPSALGGLSTLLAGLATVFVIAVALKGWKDVSDQLNELNGLLDNNTALTERNKNEAKRAYDAWMDRYKAGELNEQQTKLHSSEIQEQIYWLDVQVEKLEDEKDMLGNLTGTNKKLSEQQRNIIGELQYLIEHEEELYNQGLLNEEQTVKYAEHLKRQIELQEMLGNETSELKRKYENLTNSTYYIKAKATLEDEMTAKLNSIVSNAKVQLSSIFSLNMDSISLKWLENLTNRMPKSAVGAIVNNPGRGVPVGGTIAGEAGREGVLPLTDPGTMAELGYEIGKWITVNATLNNYMNGRLIQRQMNMISTDKDFATNGG